MLLLTAITIYSVVTILIMLADLAIALTVRRRTRRRGRYLSQCAVLSALVACSYLASILTYNKTVTAISCSVYFAAIDWTLLCLLRFTGDFVGRENRPGDKIVLGLLIAYAAIETVLFALNPVFGFSVEYIPRDTVLAHFDWQLRPLYYLHLVYTYGLVAASLALLLKKAFSCPRHYRQQYSRPAECIIVIVAVNAAFLFLPGSSVLSLLDVSVCGYSLALYALYWGCYGYAENDMLRGLSVSVFDGIDQALVLFDYDGRLVMQNKKVTQLVQPYPLPDRMPMCRFIRQCGLNIPEQDMADSYILQCTVPYDGRQRTLRCDFTRLRDKRGDVIGNLFVFTDAQLETDLLTGFHAWDSFRSRLQAEPDWITGPATVAVFDINNLSVINSSFGRDEGDRRLRELANRIRSTMPVGTYFVRGIDANLLAMRHVRDESEMLALAEQVIRGSEGSIQYSVGTISASGSVLDAVSSAMDGLQVKKLLDSDSSQSQLLNTLVQALQETDSDTEAHVQRTRRMGAALGKRLGLSDIQLGQLSLLCLLHDIGKIGIPLEILNKPGRLSGEEWDVLRSHVEKGYQIAMSSAHLQGIAEMIRHHHERWDGNGYPDGLSRESIPLLSRIIAVVDAYDAMVNDRSYRPGISRVKAIEELRRCAGTQFDPTMVAEFICVLAENPEIDGVTAKPENSSERQLPAIMPDSREQRDGDGVLTQMIHPVRFSRYVTDGEYRIVQVDEAFSEMTGYTADDIVSRTVTQWDLLPAEERLNYQMIVGEQIAQSKVPVICLEHPLLHKDGTIGFVYCYGKVYYDSAARENRVEIFISDSSQSNAVRQLSARVDSRAMQRLRQWEQTYRRDSLTGLLNHEAYRNDVEEHLLSGSSRVMLLMMDVDQFKQYNDTYGHSAGDDYLVAVANALKNALRKDDLACRMGGDEFSAALLFGGSSDEALMLRRAQQIYDGVAQAVSRIEGSTGISMGAALSNDTDDTFRVLYQKADLSLYDAKRAGRGRLMIYGHTEQ